MFSSILKVLIVVGTTILYLYGVLLVMRRLHELTLAHAFLTGDANSIIAI